MNSWHVADQVWRELEFAFVFAFVVSCELIRPRLAGVRLPAVAAGPALLQGGRLPVMMRLASLAVCATALQAPVRRRRLTRRQIAPSGVDGLPVPLQAVVFLGCAGGIGGGAVACNAALDTLRSATQKTGAGAEAWRKFVEYAFLGLGLLYVAAGVGHRPRCHASALRAITPPFWDLGPLAVPTAPAFHVVRGRARRNCRAARRCAGGEGRSRALELEAPAC